RHGLGEIRRGSIARSNWAHSQAHTEGSRKPAGKRLMFEGAKVLIAGATGFLGSSLAKHLASQGAKIRATYFSRAPSYKQPGVSWMQANLEDYADCTKAAEGMDYVFMCAANTAGAAVMAATPLVHVTPNISMNARILEAAHRAGVKKFLFISSGAAYP